MMAGGSKKIIIVSNRRLEDIHSGSAAYLAMCMRELYQAGYELHHVMAPRIAFGSRPWCVIAPSLRKLAMFHWPQASQVGDVYISHSPEVWGRFLRRLGLEVARRLGFMRRRRIRSLLSQTPSPREMADIVSALRSLSPDGVVVEYSSLGPVLSQVPEIPVRAVLFHDSFARRTQTFKGLKAELDTLPLTAGEEAARVGNANLVLHASQDELSFLSPLLTKAKHIWFRPIAPGRRHWMRRQNPACLFMGADHAGNRDALVHLLREIWPLVRRQKPDARLQIIGAVGRTIEQAPDGVEVLGVLEDLSPFAGPDIIGLAPIRLGSGIAIKIADYLGAGMPLVGYAAGLNGFAQLLNDVAICVATPTAFADAIVQLLTHSEMRERLSAAGLTLAETVLCNSEVTTAFNKAFAVNAAEDIAQDVYASKADRRLRVAAIDRE